MAGFKNDRIVGTALLLPTTAAPDAVFGAIGSITINNVSFMHSFGTSNTFLGANAGNYTLTGTNTVAIGTNALTSLTTGSQNVAVGKEALTAATTGAANTAVGFQALGSITTSSNNTAVGNSALINAMGIATANIALGKNSLSGLTTGSNNIGVGNGAGSTYTTEVNNLLIYNQGQVSDSGVIRIGTQGFGPGLQDEVFIAGIIGVTVPNPAASVVVDTVTGQLGVAAGGASPVEGLTGDFGGEIFPSGGNINVIAGISTTNCGSTVSFTGSGSTLTLDVTGIGVNNWNTIIGRNAGNTSISGNTNTGLGAANVAGRSPLQSLTSGNGNTCIGSTAGGFLTSGGGNTFVGSGAGAAMTTLIGSTALGYQALLRATGQQNTALGFATLGAVTTGQFNIAVGSGTLTSITTGSYNIGISVTGSSNTLNDTSNLYLGHSGIAGESNVLRIGSTGTGNGQQTQCYIGGIDGVNVGSVARVVTEASDKLGTAVITAGTGVTIGTSANTITINAVGSGLSWSTITVNQTAAVNNGYFGNKAGTLALLLPAVSAVGDTIEVVNINTALGIQFTQAAGQQIFVSNVSTTSGATGTLTSSAIGDSIKLVCRVANLTWHATSMIGTWSLA